jgi:copper chaperone CopZ
MAEFISLTVTGMKCGGCESNAKTKLLALEGVLSVDASHKEKKIDLEFDPEKTDVTAITQVITDAGFTVA